MPYDKGIKGWMKEGDIKALEDIALTVPKDGIVVEVGSQFGRSAACWAMTCDPSVTIYCIDIFPEECIPNDTGLSDDVCLANFFPLPAKSYKVYSLFLENTKKFKNVKHIRGESPRGIIYPEYEINVFFLDASHKNPNDWENIEYYAPFVKAGGLICGHDYGESSFPDVTKNVKKLEKKLDMQVTLYPNSSIWSFTLKEKCGERIKKSYMERLNLSIRNFMSK